MLVNNWPLSIVLHSGETSNKYNPVDYTKYGSNRYIAITYYSKIQSAFEGTPIQLLK